MGYKVRRALTALAARPTAQPPARPPANRPPKLPALAFLHQGGLSLGITREFFFNGIRIGLFEPLLDGLQVALGTYGAAPQPHEKMIAGFTAGALGGGLINPIDVAKTRRQALGGATGHQHHSAGALAALRSLVVDEGFKGALQGVGTNTVRGLIGPGSQIAAYSMFKDTAPTYGLPKAAVSTHIACSLASALVSVVLCKYVYNRTHSITSTHHHSPLIAKCPQPA